MYNYYNINFHISHIDYIKVKLQQHITSSKVYELDKYHVKKLNGKDRMFSINNINLLKQIQALRNQGIGGKQIYEIINKNNKTEIDKVDVNDELMEETITKKINSLLYQQLSYFSEQILNSVTNISEDIKTDINNNISEYFKNHTESTTTQLKEIKTNISTEIENALKSQIKEFKSYTDNIEEQFKKRDERMLDELKKSMEYRKELQEQLEKNKKGFFARLFSR